MIPLIQPDPVNQSPTVVPIPTEAIRAYFTNKELVFMVDYTRSRLKGATFLTYLSNLNVPSDIVITKDFGIEDYHTLMKAYMSQRMISNAPALNHLTARLLLLARGCPFEELPYQSLFAEASEELAQNESEAMYQFLVENKDLILRWIHFLDSSYVFAISAIQKLAEACSPEEQFDVIEDKEYVGHNVVKLYDLPAFISFYFAMDWPLRQSYFKHQFEDYMFANKRLVEWFNVPQNVIARAAEGVVGGDLTSENVEAVLTKLLDKQNEPLSNDPA